MLNGNEKENLSIKIQQVDLEEWNNLQSVLGNGEHSCTLFWTKDKQDVKLLFYSNNKTIRPLEFMDYLVQEYVLVQGGTDTAQAVLTPILLQAMMSDFEVSSVADLLEKIFDLLLQYPLFSQTPMLPFSLHISSSVRFFPHFLSHNLSHKSNHTLKNKKQ